MCGIALCSLPKHLPGALGVCWLEEKCFGVGLPVNQQRVSGGAPGKRGLPVKGKGDDFMSKMLTYSGELEGRGLWFHLSFQGLRSFDFERICLKRLPFTLVYSPDEVLSFRSTNTGLNVCWNRQPESVRLSLVTAASWLGWWFRWAHWPGPGFSPVTQ